MNPLLVVLAGPPVVAATVAEVGWGGLLAAAVGWLLWVEAGR